MFTIITEAGEYSFIPHLHILGAIPHVLVVADAGGYSSGTSPRNVCRNAWETVVL
jgi:hypothetical protein